MFLLFTEESSVSAVYFHLTKSWNEITLYRNYETPCDSDDVINDDDDNVSVTVNEISFGRRTIHKNRLRSTRYNILRKYEEENKKKLWHESKIQYISNLSASRVDRILYSLYWNRLELYKLATKCSCIQRTAHAS